MKRFITFITLLIIELSILSIDVKGSEKTSTEGGRYEIIQSKVARKYTFKLDKKTGIIYQMVKSRNDEIVWETMIILDLKYEYTITDINYQLFLGDFTVSDSFLMNIHTGKTWQLFIDDKTKDYFWAPVEAK